MLHKDNYVLRQTSKIPQTQKDCCSAGLYAQRNHVPNCSHNVIVTFAKIRTLTYLKGQAVSILGSMDHI